MQNGKVLKTHHLPGFPIARYYQKRNGKIELRRHPQKHFMYTRKPRLSMDKYGTFYINEERVFISFEWQVKAKIRFGSKKVRTVTFSVSAKDRAMAIYAMHRRFKGASILECESLTPCDFWKGCFYTTRAGHPEIPRSILLKISLPTTL